MIISSIDPEAERHLSAGCKRLEWDQRLTVFFTPLENVDWRKARGEGSNWELKAIGVDKAGIVCRVTRLLANYDMNIEKMHTFSQPSADTGTPIFHMHVLLWGQSRLDEVKLRKDLERIGDELVIDISFAPTDESGPVRTQ